MTSTHLILILLIVLVSWIFGVIRLAPQSRVKTERDLAKSIVKTKKGVFK